MKESDKWPPIGDCESEGGNLCHGACVFPSILILVSFLVGDALSPIFSLLTEAILTLRGP